MTKAQFQDAIISMVAKDSVPFAFFSASCGFRSIAQPIANKLGVSLDRDAVRNMVIDKAREVEADLIQAMNNQPIFLKMDAATRQGTSYLAINAQFVQGGRAVTRTLAVVDCAGKHTAEATTTLVFQVMARYKLRKEQVLAIVTDNASAMVKTIQLLNQFEGEKQNEEKDVETEKDLGDDEGDGDEEGDQDDAALRALFVEAHDETETSGSGDSAMHLMRCAEHTLQLAIRDGLKHKKAASVLSKIRGVARKLRAPNMAASLKKKGLPLPILEVETRWGSTFNMLKRIHELKDVIQDYAAAAPELHISDAMWDESKKLLEVLEQPYAVTIRFQSATLTPGGFMKEWVMLRTHLDGKGAVAVGIANSMRRREAKLFDCDVLLAGVFADARYRILLKGELLERAETAFIALMERIRRIHGHDAVLALSSTESSSDNTAVSKTSY